MDLLHLSLHLQHPTWRLKLIQLHSSSYSGIATIDSVRSTLLSLHLPNLSPPPTLLRTLPQSQQHWALLALCLEQPRYNASSCAVGCLCRAASGGGQGGRGGG